MNDSPEFRPDENVLAKLREIEERLERIETLLGVQSSPDGLLESAVPSQSEQGEDALEFQIGQFWFAKAGIILLALGIAFFLTFPYQNLPPALPGVVGAAIASTVVALSYFWRRTYAYLSPYLLGGGLVLLYFSVLRLHFLGGVAPIENISTEHALLVAVAAVSVVISVRKGSMYLTGISLTMGYASALTGGDPPFAFGMIVVTSAAAVVLQVVRGWQPVAVYAAALACVSHLALALGNPFLGNDLQLSGGPPASHYIILLYALVFAIGNAVRKDRHVESRWAIINSLLTGCGTYGLYLLVSVAGARDSFALSHVLASIVFLGLSVLFWVREQSRYSTFFYAMLGYLALSVAIVSRFSPGDAMIWLAWQSLLVISTAIWFRSKFIVVTNSFIFMIVLVGYVVWGGAMTAAGLSFGVVALVSARIMNAQQHRLELKTESMRNAYLVAAFIFVPYVLYNLVPTQYVSLSWLGVALVYFALNLILKKQKYRWMAIATLILTVTYILLVGIISLEPTYRILSFLALGLVLLAVSMIYARLRIKKSRT